jgi:hypothetical protein
MEKRREKGREKTGVAKTCRAAVLLGKEGAKRECRFRVGKERGITCHMLQR